MRAKIIWLLLSAGSRYQHRWWNNKKDTASPEARHPQEGSPRRRCFNGQAIALSWRLVPGAGL